MHRANRCRIKTQNCMKKFLLPLLFLLPSIGLFAQEQEQKRFIEVVGASRIEVTPDIAYFNLLLADNPKEGISVEKQEVEISKILKRYNVPAENLSIDKLSGIRQKVSFWGTKEMVNQKLYLLKLTNLSNTDNIMEELSKLKISSISLQKVESSTIEKYKLEACEKAARNAKEKAIAMAKGIEVTLTAPLNIYEQTLFVSGEEDEYQPRYMMMAKANDAGGMQESEPQQNFKNIIVKCTIRAKVEIK